MRLLLLDGIFGQAAKLRTDGGNPQLFAQLLHRLLLDGNGRRFQEGTSAAWLYDLLKPRVTKVIVCNPRKNALLNASDRRGPSRQWR